MVDDANACRDALERARKELLDLSLRNRALNHRFTKGRGLEILAQPKDAYKTIVEEEKAVTFLSAPERVESKGSEFTPSDPKQQTRRISSRVESKSLELLPYQPQTVELSPDAVESDDSGLVLYAALPQPSPKEAVDKSRLQTPHTDERLQARLLGSYRAARLSLSESGVHTLYLALGALQWYSAGSSSEANKAPLILVPVELQRANVQQRFRLVYTQDAVIHNVSLAEKLREFGIDAFPTLGEGEGESGVDVETYFDKVAEVVGRQPRWSVERSAVFIDIFSYSKFPMYKDLDPSSWPSHKQPHNHTILRALLSREGFRGTSNASALADDAFVDEYVKPEAGYTVADADSSQMRAIFEVGRGENLIIQGPPGTGKSQTITNLIAEAVSAGKKVLFVSEKMAALEVVKRNLDGLGLGDLCLELHSHKTNKKTLLETLEKTLNVTLMRSGVETNITLLSQKRARLNAYAEAVNTPINESGVTPHRAYGELLKIQDVTGSSSLPSLRLDGAERWGQRRIRKKARPSAGITELVRCKRRAGVASLLGKPSQGLSTRSRNRTARDFWGSVGGGGQTPGSHRNARRVRGSSAAPNRSPHSRIVRGRPAP